MSTRMYNRAEAMSHIHPRSGSEVGNLGGTFSPGDLSAFYSTDVKTMRAKALEGTYTIQKNAGFDAPGNGFDFVRAYRGEESRLKAQRDANIKPLSDAYSDAMRAYFGSHTEESRVAYEKAEKAYYEGRHKEFNRMLVGLHNFLRDNQKTYKYTYGLERS